MEKVILISLPESSLKNIVKEAISEALNNQSSDSSDSKTVMSINEVIDYIGISKAHCYKLTSAQKIPFSKRGRKLYFDKNEIDNWLLANPTKTSKQLADEASNYLKSKGLK